jgi:hypothetical protein
LQALLYQLQIDLRSRWRSLVVIALLVALAGGASLTAWAAARRTSTAYERMRTHTKAWDVLINPNSGSQSRLTMAQLRKLPGIADLGKIDGLQAYFSFEKSVDEAQSDPPSLASDGVTGYRFSKPVMVAGKEPAADDPNGVWLNRSFAEEKHLHVGDTFNVLYLTQQVFSQAPRPGESTIGMLRRMAAQGGIHLRVDGIGMMPDGVIIDPGYESLSIMFTPAFLAAHPTEVPYWGALVRLKPGVDMNRFVLSVQGLVPDESIAFQRATATAAEVHDSTGPAVVALEVFAALAALLGIVVVGQATSRRMQVDARDNATLAALGTTRPERAVVATARLAVAVVAGTVLALLLAWLASPIGPVGSVRVIEVHPGMHVDWLVFGIGGVAILLCGLVLSALPAYRWARATTDTVAPRRSRVAGMIAAAGGSVAAVVGIRFGLEPGAGRAAMPVRTTLLAAATAIALVTAVVVFSSSLDHLVATPRLYGSPWEAQLSLDTLKASSPGEDPTVATQHAFARAVTGSGVVSAASLLRVGEIRVGKAAIPALGLAMFPHGVEPTISAGRLPSTPHEIALGATTMARLHTAIGRTVQADVQEHGAPETLRVVGQTVLPGLAPYPGSDKAGLGIGALLSEKGWERYSSEYQKSEYVFRYRPGETAADLDAFVRRAMPYDLPLQLQPVQRPSGIVSLIGLRSTPTVLAGLIAVMLGAAVANALVVAVRRRRHDLASLRAMGLTSGQVVRTVLWQATTVALVGLVVGIPLGLVAGRWTWNALAAHLGMVSVPVMPVAATALIVVAVVALANLVGILPGMRAARSPGAVLRAE